MSQFGAKLVIDGVRLKNAKLEAQRRVWERNGATWSGQRWRQQVTEHVNDDGSAVIEVRLYRLVDIEVVWVCEHSEQQIVGEA